MKSSIDKVVGVPIFRISMVISINTVFSDNIMVPSAESSVLIPVQEHFIDFLHTLF